MDRTDDLKEELYKGVLAYVAKSLKDDPNQITATISVGMLENLTETKLDENIILQNQEDFNKNYGHLASAYGFTNFYDLYSFAVANDEYEQVSKGGKKDLSKLKKVKRTVVRNGKQTTMTFYESHDSEEQKEKKPTKPGEEEAPQPVKASELVSSVMDDADKKIPIKDLKLLSKLSRSLGAELDTSCDSFMTMKDENQEAKAILGFKKTGEFLEVAFISQDELTQELEKRAYYELTKMALAKELGARVKPESKMILLLVQADGYEEVNGKYEITYEDLYKNYGDV